jgi:hypothetical protein
MKRLITSFAILATIVGAAFSQELEADKMSIEFLPGTDVQVEIALANVVLAARNSPVQMDDDAELVGNAYELEITEDNIDELTYLVKTYFPTRSTVLSSNFVFDDDADEDLNDCDGNDDAVKGGATSRWFVKLNRPAPASGAIVRLKSSNASVTVPTAIYVRPGQTIAYYTVRTSTTLKNLKVRISGTYKNREMSSMLRVTK